MLARNFEFMKTPPESFVTAKRLPSGGPDALTHPIRSVPIFRRLSLLVRRCTGSCLQVTCKRSVVFILISTINSFDYNSFDYL